MTCSKCKKKGLLAFNCPPKYNNKIRKVSNITNKNFSQNLEQRKHENKSIEQAANIRNHLIIILRWNRNNIYTYICKLAYIFIYVHTYYMQIHI